MSPARQRGLSAAVRGYPVRDEHNPAQDGGGLNIEITSLNHGLVAMPPTVIINVGGAIGMPQPPAGPNIPTELTSTVPPNA
jgi:hypothetical protein